MNVFFWNVWIGTWVSPGTSSGQNSALPSDILSLPDTCEIRSLKAQETSEHLNAGNEEGFEMNDNASHVNQDAQTLAALVLAQLNEMTQSEWNKEVLQERMLPAAAEPLIMIESHMDPDQGHSVNPQEKINGNETLKAKNEHSETSKRCRHAKKKSSWLRRAMEWLDDRTPHPVKHFMGHWSLPKVAAAVTWLSLVTWATPRLTIELVRSSTRMLVCLVV